ncbi:hypothetical protein SAMN05421505_112220 [Sinosporangium album]|uniref:Uncharacterized protein n=1 Tax=Sinosporangium album TaxID=504805 RepID=A0A1G8ALW1_9ACTN|nr:hypothetical protein [Sinosporangium album]SDH21924.1 hypothetical protein SAMN05421505_112220 [Sinosporangium album]
MLAKTYTGALMLSVALLAGCGGGSDTAADSAAPAADGASPATGNDKGKLVQESIGKCMKGKGFKYIAYSRPRDSSEQGRKYQNGDYQTLKQERTKHGYGVFSYDVNPEVGTFPDAPTDPNGKIREQLSSSQQASYQNALETCTVEAAKSVLGMKVSSFDEITKTQMDAINNGMERGLNGDTDLIGMAQKFGDCMKSKGYAVTSLKPMDVANRGHNFFSGERGKLLGQNPDQANAIGGENKVPPARARQHLTREIKDALDDLECGKDFYAAYHPKVAEVIAQVRREYAVTAGLDF